MLQAGNFVLQTADVGFRSLLLGPLNVEGEEPRKGNVLESHGKEVFERDNKVILPLLCEIHLKVWVEDCIINIWKNCTAGRGATAV